MDLLGLFRDNFQEIAQAYDEVWSAQESFPNLATPGLDISKSLAAFIDKCEAITQSELGTLSDEITQQAKRNYSDKMDLSQFYGHVSGWAEGIWKDRKEDGPQFDDLVDAGLN